MKNPWSKYFYQKYVEKQEKNIKNGVISTKIAIITIAIQCDLWFNIIKDVIYYLMSIVKSMLSFVFIRGLYMLTERDRAFIESMAKGIQKEVGCEPPNKYDFNKVIKYFAGAGAIFKHGDFAHTRENIIYLPFYFEGKEIDDPQSHADVLFHEIWHFIEYIIREFQNKKVGENGLNSGSNNHMYTEKNTTEREESASNFFSRAMLLPEEAFREKVTEYSDINGRCDIFAVAKQFSTSFSKVISRGNDLQLWSTT